MDESTERILLGSSPSAAHRRRPWRWWGLALAWMGLIYAFSAQSSFALLDHVWQPDLLSVGAHFTEYAVLAALLWLALRSTPALARRATPMAFVVAVLYAASDELHQSFVPGRHPDFRDILVDAAGVLAALLLLRWWTRRRTLVVNE